jgi:hypothetical protein
MSRHKKAVPMLGCTALAVLGISACGSSSSGYAKQPAAHILSDATSAVKSAKSFTFAGMISNDGSETNATVAVQKPANLIAQVTLGSGVVKVAVVSGSSYLYANRAYWKAKGGSSLSASEITELSNRWYKAPASLSGSLTSSFKAVTNTSQLAACLTSTFPSPTVTGTTTVNGQSAVVLHTNGGKPGTAKANMDVATAAPHDLLRFTELSTAQTGTAPGCQGSPTDKSTGSLTFSKWNATTVSAPANAGTLP